MDQNLKVRAKTIKLLKESTGVNICNNRLGNGVIDMNDITSREDKRKNKYRFYQNLKFVFQRKFFPSI